MASKKGIKERTTVSLPPPLQQELASIQQELGLNKTELFRLACESFVQQHRKNRIQAAAQLMANEYGQPENLAFAELEGEDFL